MSILSEVDQELASAILQTLSGVLSPDKTLIDQAQQQLKVLQVRNEYCLVLVSILLDQSSQFGLRQLSGVLFKQYMEVHWSQNSEKYAEPEMDGQIKLRIKQLLPLGLNDPSSKLRTQVATSIAQIAAWDWPESWPQLFDILLAALNGTKHGHGATVTSEFDIKAVHGALETLIGLVPDITDQQMPQVAPAIIPQMYKIFIDPQNYSIVLRKRAIEIFAALIQEIANMSEYDKSAGKKFLYPFIPDFTYAMIKVLSLSPQESVNVIDYGLKKEIITVLSVLLKCFPQKLNNIINNILTQVWNCLVQSSDIYVNRVVNADSNQSSDGGSFSSNANNPLNETSDFEDEKTSFENLIYQLFEFITILKEKNKFKSTIKKAIDELCYYAIFFMQINDEQVENWSSNPEQFVQDEDDESYSYSIRISAQELIENIGQDFKKETASAMSKAIDRHMENAQKLRNANNNNWWKIHEACLLAVSSIKPILQDLLDANLLEFNLNAFVNQFVIACLHESNFPFLVGRALFTASRFPKILSTETLETLIKVTGSALHESQNPIIRVSAMKSIYCFAEELTRENQQRIIIPHLLQITEGLIQMITQNSNNQIGTLTMETLVTILAVDDKFVETIEAKVSPLAIALFIKNTNDPLVNSIITDIVKTLINNPYTYAKIEQRMMPALISILNNTSMSGEKKDISSLISSTLDLVTVFIRSSPQVPISDLTMSAFVHVVNICLKADESAILQVGSECLRAYVSKSIDQIINWKDDKGQSALNYILLVVNHMLDQKTNEMGCVYVGKFITTLIRRTAHVLGDNLESILKAVLSKIQCSQVPLVQQSLIMVFAQLIHTRMEPVLTFLSNLPGPTGKPVLEFLMNEWVNKQVSFVGTYDCKISILALAKILEHAISSEDLRFQTILVKGDRIINPVDGIKTRSKTKNDKEMYTQVPLLVKIYKLLINETHGLLEEKADETGFTEEDEEGDEEEDEDDEDENNDKEGMEDENESDTVEAYLNNYDIFDDAFDKDDYFNEYDPDALEDPLIKIDLLEYLKNYLITLSQHPCYKIFSEHHNNLERQVLKDIGIMNV